MGHGIWAKIIAAIAGVSIAAFRATPSVLRTELLVAMMFIIVDTITGVIARAYEHRVNSRTMREHMLKKLAQYAILAVLAAGFSMIVDSWLPAECMVGAIITMESVSMIENVKRMEKSGGVSITPAKPIIDWLAHGLQAPEDVIGTQKASATVTETTVTHTTLEAVGVQPKLPDVDHTDA